MFGIFRQASQLWYASTTLKLFIPLVIAIFLQQALYVFNIAFTKRDSNVRLPSAGAIGFFTYILCDGICRYFNSQPLKGCSTPFFWLQFVKTVDDLLVKRCTFEEYADYLDENHEFDRSEPTKTEEIDGDSMKPSRSAWPRLLFGVTSLWDFRTYGTPWAISKRQGYNEKDWGSGTVILFHLRRFVSLYIVLDFFFNQPPPERDLVSLHKQKFFSRISEVTVEEFITRIIFAVVFWFNSYCILQFIHSWLAISFTVIGISDTSRWTPLFGNLSKAYTIRKFWGETWHQIFRRVVTDIPDFLAKRILHINSETLPLVSRYTRLFLAFLLSGLVHVSSDLAVGIPLQESGSLEFFTIQSLGIMIEDSVQELNRRWGIVQSEKGKKVLGYVWTLLFFTWTLPTWAFPLIRFTEGEGNFLPVSLIRLWTAKND